MNGNAPSSQAIEKLKAIFFLGMKCNLVTLTGMVIVWIVLARTEWVTGFWENLFTIIVFAPVFMGDAICSYGLGRIKLELEKQWDDVQITQNGREAVNKYFYLWRAISFVPAILLAAVMLVSFQWPAEKVQLVKIAFFVGFSLHFLRNTMFMQKYFAPRIPGFGGKTLFKRSFLVASFFALAYLYLWFRPHASFSKLEILSVGIAYFIICAILQPLPTKFSLLKPGRRPKRRAFFGIEIIPESEIPASELGKITETYASSESEEQLSFCNFIRMPLLELPLFQASGRLCMDSNKKAVILFLFSEVRKTVHRSIVSWKGNSLFVTTDFGSPQAKFPATFDYKDYSKKLDLKQLLDEHFRDDAFDQIDESSVYLKLEAAVKEMIVFLETDSIAKKGGDISSANKEKLDTSSDIVNGEQNANELRTD